MRRWNLTGLLWPDSILLASIGMDLTLTPVNAIFPSLMRFIGNPRLHRSAKQTALPPPHIRMTKLSIIVLIDRELVTVVTASDPPVERHLS